LADAPVDWGDDAFDVVLVGDATGDMARAVTHAGGRVVARAAPGQSFDADPGALVAIDLAGLDDRALDAVAELAERADLVCCDWEQLDRVAGALLFTDAQFLCAPSMAERVGALAIAARELAAPAGVRDTDGVRLRRFSGEVARIAATLGQLAADEGATLADRRPAYDAGPGPVAATLDPQVVRQAIRARRLRAGFFADRLLEEPAWDMLLDLFAAELEAVPVAVSSLCIAANVAPTTALRWIVRLSDAGLFERRPDPQDRRRAFVALTARGSAAMRGYVAELARAGLRLG
jgi:hypothetical protein